MKTCAVCLLEKDVMDFYDLYDGDDRFQAICLDCRKLEREYYDQVGPGAVPEVEQDDYWK